MQYIIERTDEFNAWFSVLKDKQAQRSIAVRAARAEQGNFGDHKSVGAGVSEMRIDIGKGYRVYYTIRRQRVIFLLCGGDKSTQQKDIEKAIKIAEKIK